VPRARASGGPCFSGAGRAGVRLDPRVGQAFPRAPAVGNPGEVTQTSAFTRILKYFPDWLLQLFVYFQVFVNTFFLYRSRRSILNV